MFLLRLPSFAPHSPVMICDVALSSFCVFSAQATASDFLVFTDLFASLKKLISVSDDGEVPLIDCQYASSVLGR